MTWIGTSICRWCPIKHSGDTQAIGASMMCLVALLFANPAKMGYKFVVWLLGQRFKPGYVGHCTPRARPSRTTESVVRSSPGLARLRLRQRLQSPPCVRPPVSTLARLLRMAPPPSLSVAAPPPPPSLPEFRPDPNRHGFSISAAGCQRAA